MGLLFEIPSKIEEISYGVDLDISSHEKIRLRIISGRYDLLSRIADYFSNARYAGNEVELLQTEIKRMLRECDMEHQGVRDFLISLQELLENPLSKTRGINVLAD
jgi:hypothetical protein